MAINKKLIHFKTKAAYDREKKAGNILDTSIVYVKDAKKIYTHDEEYNCDSYTKEEVNTLLENAAQENSAAHNNLNKGISAVLKKVNDNKGEVDSELTVLNNRFNNYQPTLTAGEGIKIENNVVSSTLDTSLIRVVTSLPEIGIEINKIYVVPNSSGEGENIYDEYIYANGAWEKVGSFSSVNQKQVINLNLVIEQNNITENNFVITSDFLSKLDDYMNKSADLFIDLVFPSNPNIIHACNPSIYYTNDDLGRIYYVYIYIDNIKYSLVFKEGNEISFETQEFQLK